MSSGKIALIYNVRRAMFAAAIANDVRSKRHYNAPFLLFPFDAMPPDAVRH